MLNIKGLTRRYKSGDGIDDVNLSLETGQVVAIVGPNGAGKTTLLKCILSLIKADSGYALFNGKDIEKLYGSEVTFLLDEYYLIENFSVRQMVEYFVIMKDLKEMDSDDIERILKEHQLEKYTTNKIKSLSLGTKKRVALMLTFLGEPELLILDEPTNSLDTDSILILKEDIQQAAKRGALVLVTSHILDFVGNIADEIVFLVGGKIVKEMRYGEGQLEAVYKEVMRKEKND